MRTNIRSVLVLALLAWAPAVPAAAPAGDLLPVQSSTTPADREALMRALLDFVLQDYLGTGRGDHENRAEIYAPRVTYYQRGEIAREAVLADKRAYYRRWPSRTYTYIPDSLRIERGGDDGVAITFRHTYEVARGAERRRGTAMTRLVVTLQDDRFVIQSEGGAVERR